eukprot:COSAG01_NODE_56772_length_316_cov_0.884793_1_plen_43_part_01
MPASCLFIPIPDLHMHHGSCFLQYGRQQQTFVLFYSTVASSPS